MNFPLAITVAISYNQTIIIDGGILGVIIERTHLASLSLMVLACAVALTEYTTYTPVLAPDNMDYEAGEENRRSEHREKITYPLPAIYAGIHKGYKVSGDFKSGTKLKMAISGCQADVTINVKDFQNL